MHPVGERHERLRASMGPGRKPRKEPCVNIGGRSSRTDASMGPGRKPRKERCPGSRRVARGRGFNGAWAKTQEGTRGGLAGVTETISLQWGLGENPGRNLGAALREVRADSASMGPGRKPRKELPRFTRSWPPRWSFNGAWAKTQEGTGTAAADAGCLRIPLQWGLGENPGRNSMIRRRTLDGRPASMGPGRKPRKELAEACARALIALASMGPGRKPRKEHLRWRGRNCARPSFNGAWAKTQEGTCAVSLEVSDDGLASMGPGRKPRKELAHSTGSHNLPKLQWGLGENPGRNGDTAPTCQTPEGCFNGAWAKTQEGTIVYGCDRLVYGGWLQWGLGENPGRNFAREAPEQGTTVMLQWGLGENPGRNPTSSTAPSVQPPMLQWGLGENPGRNTGRQDRYRAAPVASMGPGRKPRKELDGDGGQDCAAVGASMGPGRKPRKELELVTVAVVDVLRLQWGLGENPGRNRDRGGGPLVSYPLQWGLGENPGRNMHYS